MPLTFCEIDITADTDIDRAQGAYLGQGKGLAPCPPFGGENHFCTNI